MIGIDIKLNFLTNYFVDPAMCDMLRIEIIFILGIKKRIWTEKKKERLRS
jgi:hypothetical protein